MHLKSFAPLPLVRYDFAMEISEITNDPAAGEFSLLIDGVKAFVSYQRRDQSYRLMHAEVPAALRGKGAGRILAERTFQAIKDEGSTGVAYCGYLRKVLNEEDRWDGVISLPG